MPGFAWTNSKTELPSNWLRLKFQLKSWSNWLLINLFDPNCSSESASSRQNWLIWTWIWSKILKSIEIDLKEIKRDWKSWNTSNFLIEFDFFDLLIDIKVIFFDLLIENWLNSIARHWHQNWRYDFNFKIRTVIWIRWNPILNLQQFNSGTLIT